MTQPAHAAQNGREGTGLRAAGVPVQAESRAPLFPDPPLGACLDLRRLSGLTVRLARSDAEIRQAQALRYRVFYEDGNATADRQARSQCRDVDRFDACCDHLVVVDESEIGADGRPAIVGTYRLLRQDVAERNFGFYSAGEFELRPLLAAKSHLRFLELGRSCVAPAYRTRRTVELLWQGIWAYACAHRIDVMIGCASLAGTDPARLAQPLAFLHHTAAAPPEWSACVCAAEQTAIDRLAAEQIDPRAALRALPPLLRAYLKVGAFIGEGAAIDRQFGTTDVLVILPVSRIQARYLRHYGDRNGRYAS